MPPRGPVIPPPPPPPPPSSEPPRGEAGPRGGPILADPGDRTPRTPGRVIDVPDPGSTGDDGGGDPGDPTPSILPSDRATQRTNNRPQPREVTITSPEGEPIPVTIGKLRQAGDLIYCKSDGISKLYVAISFGWGTHNANYDPTLDNFDGAGYGLRTGSSSYNVYLGTPDQAVDPILSAFDPDNWFSAYPGLSYVVYVLDLNVEKNQTVNPTSYKTTIEGVLSPDHRLDDTLSTTYYHENPCVGLEHVFLDQSWGFGADTTQMRWPTWDESADDCDAIIASPDDGAPSTAPTVVVFGYGLITNPGIRQWGYTWVYANGLETTISDPSSDVSNLQSSYAVNVSGMDVGTDNVAKIRLYRRKKDDGGGYGPWLLVTELNPKQSTYHDGNSDFSLGAGHPPSSNDKAQFRIGLKMATQASMRDWIETFRTLFTAFVAFNNGQYQCSVDKERDDTGIVYGGGPPASNITGNIEVLTVGIAEQPSYVVVNFVDQDAGFLGDQRTWPEGSPVASDIMVRLEKRPWEFQCEGCPSADQAAHIASWAWIRGQRAHRIKWRTNQTGLLVLPLSLVSVSHPAQDFGTAKVVITSTGPVDDTLGFNLAGEIYSVSDYNWTYAPGFTHFPGPGGQGTGGPGDNDPPPTPLILRWRNYLTDVVVPAPPE